MGARLTIFNYHLGAGSEVRPFSLLREQRCYFTSHLLMLVSRLLYFGRKLGLGTHLDAFRVLHVVILSARDP